MKKVAMCQLDVNDPTLEFNHFFVYGDGNDHVSVPIQGFVCLKKESPFAHIECASYIIMERFPILLQDYVMSEIMGAFTVKFPLACIFHLSNLGICLL